MDSRPREKYKIARRFRALRRKASLSQLLLGEIIGVCRQSVNEIENRRVMPHPSTWARFSELEARHNRPKIVLSGNWLHELISEISAEKGDKNRAFR